MVVISSASIFTNKIIDIYIDSIKSISWRPQFRTIVIKMSKWLFRQAINRDYYLCSFLICCYFISDNDRIFNKVFYLVFLYVYRSSEFQAFSEKNYVQVEVTKSVQWNSLRSRNSRLIFLFADLVNQSTFVVLQILFIGEHREKGSQVEYDSFAPENKIYLVFLCR